MGDHPFEEVDHLMVAVQPRPETGDWESDFTPQLVLDESWIYKANALSLIKEETIPVDAAQYRGKMPS